VAAEAPVVTASRLGLAILTAIALALGVVVALDQPPAAVPRSNRLLPGFDPERITGLRVERAGAAVVLARDDAGWQVREPAPGPADAAVVADVLGALELAAAERWADGSLDARTVVTATDDRGGQWRLAVGDPGAGGLVRARGQNRLALVEPWIARALDVGVAELRRRAVVPVAQPTGLELHAGGVDLVASGVPLRAHLASGIVRLAPDRARALVDALASLRFVALPTHPAPEPVGTVRVLGGAAPIELDDLGPCPGAPDRRWLAGSAGAGCVEGAAWSALLAAAADIVASPRAAVDPSPIDPSPVTRLELRDGVVLEARGAGWTLTAGGVESEADPAAVSALLADLRAPGRVVPAADGALGQRVLSVVHADGTTVNLALAGAVLRRDGEPFAIEIPAALASRLLLGSLAVADHTLLAEEPTLLRRITTGPLTLTMGASFTDWTATSGTPDLAAIESLRDLTSSLHADQLLPESPITPLRTLTLAFDPPPTPDASPTTHTIAVAKPAPDGRCRARVDRTLALLPADACAILLAPLVR
jgi:hypothetical protein